MRTSSTSQHTRHTSHFCCGRTRARKSPASGKLEQRGRVGRFMRTWPGQERKTTWGVDERIADSTRVVRAVDSESAHNLKCTVRRLAHLLKRVDDGPVVSFECAMPGLGTGSLLEGGKYGEIGGEKDARRVASVFWMLRRESVVRHLREQEAPFEVFATRTVRPQRRA
ncbi:hypothetical protein BKA93DRAFT_588193 [Sparassis latifolia]